jgi:hypothetical protein
MKAISLSLPLLFGGLSGCGDDGGPPPDPPGPASTITITSDVALALVAFRDGVDGRWQPATMKSPTTFEAVVHGPYVVTSVCDNVPGNVLSVWQIARTPDDERAISLQCSSVLVWPAVTGTMVQAGTVQLDRASRASSTASWSFSLSVPPGTYDLLAKTTDRFALRRAIAVSGNTAVTPQIDLTQEGAAFDSVAFTVSNAAAGEEVVASVHLNKPSPLSPLSLYRGPIATAKVAPDSALDATDVQSASVQATAGAAFRALRRPFRVGGNTAYTLPDPVTGVQWEIARDLSGGWTSVPPFDSFQIYAFGHAGTKGQSHQLQLSPRFVAATGATSAAIETEIEGYQPAWRIDFTREYTRQLFVQSLANGEIASSSVTETVNAGTQLAGAAPRLPPAGAGLAEP